MSDDSINKIDKNYIEHQSPLRLAPDRLPKPIIRYVFSKNRNRTGHILVDSGAAVSLVNENALTPDNHTVAGKRTKRYKGAGDEPLPLGDYLVNVKVDILNVGQIEIKNAVVCKGKQSNAKILMGTPDIQRLGLILNYNTNTIQITRGTLKNKILRMPTIRSLMADDKAFEIIEQNRTQSHFSESIQTMFESLICMVLETDIKNDCVSNTQHLKSAADKKNPLLSKEILKSPEDSEGILDSHKIESSNDSNKAVIGDPCTVTTDPLSYNPCKGCDQCVDPELAAILKNKK